MAGPDGPSLGQLQLFYLCRGRGDLHQRLPSRWQCAVVGPLGDLADSPAGTRQRWVIRESLRAGGSGYRGDEVPSPDGDGGVPARFLVQRAEVQSRPIKRQAGASSMSRRGRAMPSKILVSQAGTQQNGHSAPELTTG